MEKKLLLAHPFVGLQLNQQKNINKAWRSSQWKGKGSD